MLSMYGNDVPGASLFSIVTTGIAKKKIGGDTRRYASILNNNRHPYEWQTQFCVHRTTYKY